MIVHFVCNGAHVECVCVMAHVSANCVRLTICDCLRITHEYRKAHVHDKKKTIRTTDFNTINDYDNAVQSQRYRDNLQAIFKSWWVRYYFSIVRLITSVVSRIVDERANCVHYADIACRIYHPNVRHVGSIFVSSGVYGFWGFVMRLPHAGHKHTHT